MTAITHMFNGPDEIFNYIIIFFPAEDGRTDPNHHLLNFSHLMKPVEVLKKGLSKLRGQIRERKVKLEADLKAGRPVSEADQDWLDGDGNLVDEERVVEAFDKASDYEQHLERLSSCDKLIVDKLQKLAGKVASDHVPSKKRKRSATNHGDSDTPSNGKKPMPPSKKKENATLQQRINILDWHRNNKATQQGTVDHFNKVYPSLQLTQPLVSSWVTNDAKW
ncbi:hypothetical protein JVU11DRAFT_2575 [Chiua virens]|nr:hypothetical protein JVU11DRAFT_2575 [Chiua virens]